MALYQKEISLKAGFKTAALVRLLAAAQIIGGGGFILLFIVELNKYGTEWMQKVEGGEPGAWLAIAGFIGIPVILVVWLGIGLWRLSRPAWVLEMALGVLLVFAFGLGLPIVIILSLKSTRWLFGIGPDAVLAEIDALEVVTVLELGEQFRVRPDIIETVLEQAIAAGLFAGAFDREKGILYSVDTIVSRNDIQRCPHCGGGTEALGNLAACPYCGTEFAKLRGLDFPMPAPIGLSVIRALDNLFCYWWVFLMVVWMAIIAKYDFSQISTTRLVLVYVICGVLPLALAAGYYITGRMLDAGQTRGWVLQAILFPLVLPYLLLRRVRLLFGLGLGELKEKFDSTGELSMDALSEIPGVKKEHTPELAVFLTATGKLDGILDWHKKRILRRSLLQHDGRENCPHCGAPNRVGGWCGYCGAGTTAREKKNNNADNRTEEPFSKGINKGRVLAAAFLLGLVALFVIFSNRDSKNTDSFESEYTANTDTVSFVKPAAGYTPSQKESFITPGITLAVFSRETFLSGEGNGLFVWDLQKKERVLRTPKNRKFAGIRWVDFLNNEKEFLAVPYYRGILRGTTGNWAISEQIDLDQVYKKYENGFFGHMVLCPDGTVLIAIKSKSALYIHNLGENKLVQKIETGTGLLKQVLFDPRGKSVAVLPIQGNRPLLVWDIASGKMILEWTDSGKGIFGVSLSEAAFESSGKLLAAVGLSKLYFVDVPNGKILGSIKAGSASAPICFSNDGTLFAVATNNSGEFGAAVYTTKEKKLLHRFGGHKKRIKALAFNSDGSVIASGDSSGVVQFSPVAR
ncbi:MAG: hypothetical protein GY754_35760 [bacterium]|nr:hypothetical protein [bacterium]